MENALTLKTKSAEQLHGNGPTQTNKQERATTQLPLQKMALGGRDEPNPVKQTALCSTSLLDALSS